MGSVKEFTRADYFIMDVDLSRFARGPEAARAAGTCVPGLMLQLKKTFKHSHIPLLAPGCDHRC